MKLHKFINFFLLIFFVLLAVVFEPQKHLSTNLFSLLPNSEEVKFLKIYEHFKSSNEVVLAIEGESIESLAKITSIEQEVLKMPFISKKKFPLIDREFSEYRKKYRYILDDFNASKLQGIENRLLSLWQQISSNPYYVQIDRDDPLGAFKRSEKISSVFLFKKGHLYLKNYGYLSLFTVDKNAKKEQVYEVFKKYIDDGTKVFSPIFYFVENSNTIKNEVNFLSFLAILAFVVVYLFVLRDISLFMNATATLISASLCSILLVTSIWSNVSLFVVVFGIAISTISIDYMFHHYFCGYYADDKGFNKSVFLGFFSTFMAFFLLSFIHFPFIQELSVFACISLLYSYVIFAFVYKKIGFKKRKESFSLSTKPIVKSRQYGYIFIFLMIVIALLVSQIHIDTNIRNLDYSNKKLKNLEAFFYDKMYMKEKNPIVFKAKNIDELIAKAVKIKHFDTNATVLLSYLVDKNSFEARLREFAKYDFNIINKNVANYANKIGFRKDFFVDAYSPNILDMKMPKYTIDFLQRAGFEIYFDGDEYYSNGLVSLQGEIQDAYVINSTKVLKNTFVELKKEFFYAGLSILFMILIILYKWVGKNYYKVLSFLAFPLVLILMVLAWDKINILQIFMIFIVLALSLDYGIYMSQEKVTKNSVRAIFFSLLTTFAGFGVLVFSTIPTLFFIGEVAILGIFGVMILLVLG